MKRKPLRVLILCGGPSSEHEVSLNTAQMILKSLDRKKYVPTLLTLEKGKKWSDTLMQCLARPNFDFVVIAMHGAFGEDGRIQAILELVGIPYWGSGVASSALAMDKNLSNLLFAANGLAVAKYVVVDTVRDVRPLKLVFPVVVKPLAGGSSVGVSIIKTKKELHGAILKSLKLGSRVMVQEYVKGREFTCGVIAGKDGRPIALPPTEIIPKAATFFDYEAKYKLGGSLEVTPANISNARTKEIQKMALAAHELLGCRGMSRSDFILAANAPLKGFYILETNTIPGMTATSLLPQAAKAAGISFPKLLDMIISAGLTPLSFS